MKRESGRYITVSTAGEPYQAFVPAPLPPDPPLSLGPELLGRLDTASRALGRLDGVADHLPDPDLFLYQYIRKEAVLSSQIEGTQSSLSDLILYEADETPNVPEHDVREVSDYVAALQHGLDCLDTLPLSLRLIREIHAILLQSGRGRDKDPGEFRRSQVWLGGTRLGNATFVPPPVDQMMDCLAALELFLHTESRYPPLIRAGMVHVQFETIHPFLDGNGRVGRLLITLLLCAEGVLSMPLLYLSLFFKLNRLEYYDRLNAVRADGDWEAWIGYFLRGVEQVAEQAFTATRAMSGMFETHREQIRSMGRSAGSVLQVHEMLTKRPILTTAQVVKALQLTKPTVNKAFDLLQKGGLVEEITGNRRNRKYKYTDYIAALAEGTEP